MTMPKTLNPSYDKDLPALGRPLAGGLRYCKDCGKEIYVRRYRLKETGNRCLECSRKHLPEYAKRPRKAKVQSINIVSVIDDELRKIKVEMPKFSDLEWMKQRLIGQRLMLNYLRDILTGKLNIKLRGSHPLV